MKTRPEPPPVRFELRLYGDLGAAIDDWRRAQPDLPSKNEAIRRLVELGLSVRPPSPKRTPPRK
jgi:hypothetical protein